MCRGNQWEGVEVSQGESLPGRWRHAADPSLFLHRCFSGIGGGLSYKGSWVNHKWWTTVDPQDSEEEVSAGPRVRQGGP